MPDITSERNDGVVWIRLNRPAKHNALTPQAVCQLADTWDKIRDDESVRVAIVTGSGERAFCSGADLGRLVPLLTGARRPDDEYDERILADRGIVQRALLRDVELDTPVIAAVNGIAYAAGFLLVLGADLRVASRTATFALNEAQRGLVPMSGGMVRLPRQIPHAVAMELLLTGEPIDAVSGYRIGLINRVVAPNDLVGETINLAERLAANGPLALRTIKRMVRASSGLALAEAYVMESEQSKVVLSSYDAVEGSRAFIEDRRPRFTGR